MTIIVQSIIQGFNQQYFVSEIHSIHSHTQLLLQFILYLLFLTINLTTLAGMP